MSGQPPDLTTLDLDDAIRRRASPRRRAAQIGAVVALFVVALGIVAYDVLRAHSPPVAVVPPAVLVSNVSFGTVTLNGQRLSSPPPVALPLREGTNRITLSAPPFAARTCQLTWQNNALASIGDCPAEGRDSGVVVGGHLVHPILIVALTFSDYDLPAASLASAREAIAAELAASAQSGRVVLLPGESIATGGFFPVQVNTTTASTYMSTTLSFTLPNQAPGGPFPSACNSYNQGNVICAGAPLIAPASAAEWAVTLNAAYQWTVSDFNGKVVATSMEYPLVPPADMLLDYDGASGWKVDETSLFPTGNLTSTWANKLCGAGADVLEASTQAYHGTATIVQDQGVGGCELLVTLDNGHTARFIWRCGVLLADNAQASQLLPGVPLALPAVDKQFGA